jgi:hypothetical protein
MNNLLSKMAITAMTLGVASAPLAASAADWDHHGGYNNDRGGYNDRRHDDRGRYDRDDRYRRDVGWRGGYSAPYYPEGYYGIAPGGFYGYFSNGNWFRHRRWSGGVWIYF